MTATTSFTSADLLPLHGADAISFELTPTRVALVAPRGLFRDSLAHVMARFVEDVHLECYDDVEDVVFGPASLGLIAFDPLLTDRSALRAKIAALRTQCGGAPVGVVVPDERAPAAAGLGALGVAGVVSQSAGAAVAFAAIRLMAIGGYCLPPETSSGFDSFAETIAAPPNGEPYEAAVTGRGANDARRGPQRNDLTPRERDVLRSLRGGHQNKIIAFELGISESTVKVHLRNIMKKLHASNRTQVALGAAPAL
jgi:DNA-binding NarL/FixJ family response regulator